jgi:hypothetical protein
MADEQRCIGVDLSWVDESEHRGAREAIPTDLLRAGWQLARGDSDQPTFCRPNSPDFDQKLAQAQYIVGPEHTSE